MLTETSSGILFRHDTSHHPSSSRPNYTTPEHLSIRGTVATSNIILDSQKPLPPSVQPRAMACPGFEGNPDFYGFGIRLGVYLQWLSSWVSNSLHPPAARTNHTPNSIFVLAILVSMTVSVQSQEIKPVEAYIMILICFGFSLTVMSSLGIRLFFLRPSSLSLFVTTFRERVPKVINSVVIAHKAYTIALRRTFSFNESTHTYKRLWISFIKGVSIGRSHSTRPPMSLDDISFVKHWSFSWSGVLWRSAILSYLTGLSLWLWWSPWISQQERCESAIYFFGPQTLGHGMITFYKVASIIAALPIVGLTFFILAHAIPIVTDMYSTSLGVVSLSDVLEPFLRDVIIPTLDGTRTGPSGEPLERVSSFWRFMDIVEPRNPQRALDEFGYFIARGEAAGQAHAGGSVDLM